MIALYLLCAVAGVSYVALGAFLGHFGGHGHAGGGHGHAAPGHVDAGSFDALPFFSPTALAAYVTGFGAAGLLLTKGLHITDAWIHVPAAMGLAGAFGVGTVLALAKLSEKAEGNTLASLDDVIGTDVEVTIAIPAEGQGEVAFVAGATRQNCIASAEAGQVFEQGARVRVTRVVDGTVYVTHASALPAGDAVPLGEPLPSPPRNKVH